MIQLNSQYKHYVKARQKYFFFYCFTLPKLANRATIQHSENLSRAFLAASAEEEISFQAGFF